MSTTVGHYDLYSSWGDACMILITYFTTFDVRDFTKHHEYREIELSAKMSRLSTLPVDRIVVTVFSTMA